MPDLSFDPPARGAKPNEPFVQSITLMSGGQAVGFARWACATDPGQGVVQLIELSVHPEHRRTGHGGRLMEAVTQQAKAFFQQRKGRLRRVWTTLEQKRQVVGRSFLMQFGFNHVGTVSELLKDEDLLVYMRTFD
jgi:GNAT superfamily N-acetyltransferase